MGCARLAVSARWSVVGDNGESVSRVATTVNPAVVRV